MNLSSAHKYMHMNIISLCAYCNLYGLVTGGLCCCRESEKNIFLTHCTVPVTGCSRFAATLNGPLGNDFGTALALHWHCTVPVTGCSRFAATLNGPLGNDFGTYPLAFLS